MLIDGRRHTIGVSPQKLYALQQEEEESFTKEATKSAKPMKGRKQEIEMKLSSSSRS